MTTNYLGTELFMFDDKIVLLSQHGDSAVVLKDVIELYAVLAFWGFEEKEINSSLGYLREEKHNHVNFGMFNTMIFTSNKSEKEFEEFVDEYAQRRMVS